MWGVSSYHTRRVADGQGLRRGRGRAGCECAPRGRVHNEMTIKPQWASTSTQLNSRRGSYPRRRPKNHRQRARNRHSRTRAISPACGGSVTRGGGFAVKASTAGHRPPAAIPRKCLVGARSQSCALAIVRAHNRFRHGHCHAQASDVRAAYYSLGRPRARRRVAPPERGPEVHQLQCAAYELYIQSHKHTLRV